MTSRSDFLNVAVRGLIEGDLEARIKNIVACAVDTGLLRVVEVVSAAVFPPVTIGFIGMDMEGAQIGNFMWDAAGNCYRYWGMADGKCHVTKTPLLPTTLWTSVGADSLMLIREQRAMVEAIIAKIPPVDPVQTSAMLMKDAAAADVARGAEPTP